MICPCASHSGTLVARYQRLLRPSWSILLTSGFLFVQKLALVVPGAPGELLGEELGVASADGLGGAREAEGLGVGPVDARVTAAPASLK